MYSLTILEATEIKAVFLWRLSDRLVPVFSSFWWLQVLLGCGWTTLILASIFTWPFPHCQSSPFPSLIRTVVIGFRTHLYNPGWCHLETFNNYLCKDPFSKYGHIHRFWGLGCGHIFWGANTQPTTTSQRNPHLGLHGYKPKIFTAALYVLVGSQMPPTWMVCR